jgi:protein Mpv17
MLSGLVMGAVGDWVCQALVEEKTLDKKRNAVVGTYGALEIGVEAKMWLPMLDRILGPQMNTATAVKKMIVDQLTYTPIEMACFMKWTNKLEQRSEDFSEKMKRDYSLAVASSVVYWLPVSFVNFSFVPLKYRALYISFTTFLIDIFNSFASHNNLRQAFNKELKLIIS